MQINGEVKLSNLMVLHHDNVFQSEKEFLENRLPDWEFHYFSHHPASDGLVERTINEYNVHFLIYAQNLTTHSLQLIRRLKERFPLLTIIFYNSQMKSEEFAQLFLAGVDYCIIGDARQINLINTLEELWENHWKRIPHKFFPADLLPLSKRAAEIVHFIETRPLRFFTSYNIAEFFNYSESHFRAEFKKVFKTSFRVFKQKLLSHYEYRLLFEKKLKPKEIIEILNYKNISAFSRSFKTRHGHSWQTLIRQSEHI